MAILPGMAAELAVYGLISGLLIVKFPAGRSLANIYIALILAMISGRIVSGLLNALIFRAGHYSLQVWVTASFIKAIPGIIIQFILIPILVLSLQRAGFSSGSRLAGHKAQ